MSSLVRTTALAALLPLLATPFLRAGAQSQSGTPAATPAAPPPPSVVARDSGQLRRGEGRHVHPARSARDVERRACEGRGNVDARATPEIYQMIESTQFGRAPGKPDKVVVDRFDAGNAGARRKGDSTADDVVLHRGSEGTEGGGVVVRARRREGPGAAAAADQLLPQLERRGRSGDPSGEMWGRDHKRVPAPATGAFARVDPLPFLAKGIGFATLYYGDIEPDFNGGIPFGIRGQYLKGSDAVRGG